MDDDRKAALKAYNELKAKYDLPELENLEKEFDFELEDDKIIAKTIINHIWEKISSIKSYIEGTLNPQRYCCIVETKFLNAKEKEKIFNFYKRIMSEYWSTVKATFGSPEEKINKIKDSFEFYKKVKKFSKDYIQRMIDGWNEKESADVENDGYIN